MTYIVFIGILGHLRSLWSIWQIEQWKNISTLDSNMLNYNNTCLVTKLKKFPCKGIASKWRWGYHEEVKIWLISSQLQLYRPPYWRTVSSSLPLFLSPCTCVCMHIVVDSNYLPPRKLNQDSCLFITWRGRLIDPAGNLYYKIAFLAKVLCVCHPSSTPLITKLHSIQFVLILWFCHLTFSEKNDSNLVGH